MVLRDRYTKIHKEVSDKTKMDGVGIGYWRAVLDFREMMNRGYTLQEMWSLVFKPFVCGPLVGERTPLSIPKREKKTKELQVGTEVRIRGVISDIDNEDPFPYTVKNHNGTVMCKANELDLK